MGREELEYLLGLYSLARNDHRFKIARWASKEEVEILYNLVEEFSPRLVLECGTANGWTALCMAYALPKKGRLVTFDIVDRPKILTHPKIEYVTEDFSIGGPRTLRKNRGSKLIFIDGDHKWRNVKRDVKAVWPYLREGDALVFHDMRDTGPKSVFEKFSPGLKTRTYDTHNGLGVIYGFS